MTRAKERVVRKAKGKHYEIHLQPSTPEMLKNVREDIREMDWKCLDEDQHTILVAKADVIQILNEWIAYCLKEWPALSRKRRKNG